MIWLFVAVLTGMLLTGRWVREAAAKARAEQVAEAASLARLRVRISTPGDIKPKRKHVTERYAIENAVERERVGTIVDSSIGESWVELELAARDPEAARAALLAILDAHGVADRATVTDVR